MKKQLIILDLDLSAVKPTIDYYMEQNPDSEYEFIVHQSENLWRHIEKGDIISAFQHARQLIKDYQPHVIVSNGFQGIESQVIIFKECSSASYVGNSSMLRYNIAALDAGADAIFAKDYDLSRPRGKQKLLYDTTKEARGMDPDFILWMIDNYDKLVAFEKPEEVVKMRANCLISHYDMQSKETEKVQKVPVKAQKVHETIQTITQPSVTKPWWKFW